MFHPPRFVLIDDQPEHLDAILDVFRQLGTPCLGITYDAERGLGENASSLLSQVRVLFLDLHLTDMLATTDDSRHFGTIAGILQANISPTGGPFLLVIWTSYGHEVEGLRRYLDEALRDSAPHARPLAVVRLSKDRYIDKNTGATLSDRAESLHAAVVEAVNEIPQLAALVQWETDVQAATGATLAALVESIPNGGTDSAPVTDGLSDLLTRLAVASAGEVHSRQDPRGAVGAALTPLLADRVAHQETSPAATEKWSNALSDGSNSGVQSGSAAALNRMLHLALQPAEDVRPDAWGTVVEFPTSEWNDECLNRRFGVTPQSLLADEFKIQAEQHADQRPRLIRVGAVCDYAQSRPGPISYFFGIETPPRRAKQLPQSVWTSPPLLLDPSQGVFQLEVNTRFVVTTTSEQVREWRPVYRLREQLLMHLISHGSNHLSRPGLLAL